jgi:two-component system LytT family response regulator
VRQTISSLELELDPDVFVRVHRSTIVQAARISELVALRNGECLVRLRDGTELRTSRSYGRKLEKWLRSAPFSSNDWSEEARQVRRSQES